MAFDAYSAPAPIEHPALQERRASVADKLTEIRTLIGRAF